MRLESARELKLSLVALARSRTAGRFAQASRRLGLVSHAPRDAAARVAPRAGIAFGVSPLPGRAGEFALAVRVVQRGAPWLRALLARIPGLASRELDLALGVRYRPRARATNRVLQAGVSCGHRDITAGTLGGFVEDEGRHYALSNNHVFADCDRARKGDEIWQPGPYDAERGRHRVLGHLARWARLEPVRTDGVDAALAELDGDFAEFEPWNVAGVGELDPRPHRERHAVARVIKRGRTSGVTRGRVSALELDGVSIDYGTRLESLLVTFDDQLEFVHTSRRRAFSQAGDSGSLILDAATLRPYALLYGGGADADGVDRTLGHFLPSVLTRLGVRMVAR